MIADSVAAYLKDLPGQASHQRAVARDPVSAPAIRTWCDAMGSGTRFSVTLLWHGLRVTRMCSRPRRHCRCGRCQAEPGGQATAGPARAGDLDEEVRGRLADFGYPGALAATTDQEFLSDIRVDDLLTAEDVYVDVSDLKQTSLGPGYFLAHRITYVTAGGRVVGRMTATVFHFRPRPGAALADPAPTPAKQPGLPADGSPGDLVAGARLGPVRIPVTATLIIAGACATRDFYPVHHDRDFARAHGNTDILMNILTSNGLLARVIGEWTSNARLHSLVTRLRAPAHPHDELFVTGTVSSAGGGRAELDRPGAQPGLACTPTPPQSSGSPA